MITHRNNSQKNQRRTILASALLAAGLGIISSSVHAGIMVTDYDLQLYGDFAEGKGIFANSNKPVNLYDKNGTFRGTIAKPLSSNGISDWMYLTVIAPGYGISANHVGNIQNATFGLNSKFIYNDGTLFEGSASKPYASTELNDAEFRRVLSNPDHKNLKNTFTKYLAPSYNEVFNDQLIVKLGSELEYSDFSLLRYNKLFIDSTPVPTVKDHTQIKVGDVLARVGAGTSGYITRDKKAEPVQLLYATPIGGITIVQEIEDFSTIKLYTNPDDLQSPSTYTGKRLQTWLRDPGHPNEFLEVGTLGGDSGSPIFWYDNGDQEWKLVGVTSRNLNNSSQVVDFGQHVEFIGNLPWANERMKYYDSSETKLNSGDTVVFHGQNTANGFGNIHIVSAGTEDIVDAKIAADTARVAKLNQAEYENIIYQAGALYRYYQQVDFAKKAGKPAPEKRIPNKVGYTKPSENQYYNSYYGNQPGIRYQTYYGFATGYDFSKLKDPSKPEYDKKAFPELIEGKKQELHKKTRNLIFRGSGKGNEHLITFNEDIQQSNNTINLGADSITLYDGDFILAQNPKYTEYNKKIKSFINAGYIIDESASLTFKLDGELTDPIHKLGKGTLRIAGIGNQLSPLNIGEGTVELDQDVGAATSYLKLASGRATAKLMRDNQLPTVGGKANTHALGFGLNGGTFDFNSHDKNTVWADIYHLDGGATFTNSAQGENNRVTFTFAPNGKRTYLGSFTGNMNVVFDPKLLKANETKEWLLKGAVDIDGDFKLAKDTTVTIGDVLTERGWGYQFDDRYDLVSFISKSTTLEGGNNLNIGRHTIFASNITSGESSTINVHNRGKYSDLSKPQNYGIVGQHELEKTVLVGSVDLKASSKLKLDVDAESFIDVHSSLKGSGAITLNGKGTINLLGKNDAFTGQVKVCNADANDPTCTTELNFTTQSGSDYRFETVSGVELPEIVKEFTTSSNMASATTAPTLSGYSVTLSESGNSNVVETNSATGTAGKPEVSESQFNDHKSWTEQETANANKEDQAYNHGTNDVSHSIVPVPDADSLVVNFFSKDALFTSASSIDTTNTKVVFHTNFADSAATDTYQWDLGNITGDAFVIKSDVSTLQIKNYNLRGTMFVLNGKVVTDRATGHLVIGKGGTLVADARGADRKVTLKGRVVNAGEIYLTKKADKLPAQTYASDKPATATPPEIGTANSTGTTAETSSSALSTLGPALASSDLTLSNGVILAQALQPHHIALLAADDSLTLANTTSATSTTSDGKLQTGPTANRNLSTLDIDGDYYGQGGKIIYDLGEDAYTVNVKGNVDGTTQLVVQDIKASMATGKEKFDLFSATGTVAKDSITLANGYASGGIYDYVILQSGNHVYMVNQYNEEAVQVVPDPVVEPEPAPVPLPTPEQPNTQPDGQNPPPVTDENTKPSPDTSTEPPSPDSGTTDSNQGSTDKDNGTGSGTDVTLPTPNPAPELEPKPEPAPDVQPTPPVTTPEDTVDGATKPDEGTQTPLVPTPGTENDNSSSDSSTDNNPGNGNNGSTDVTLPEPDPSQPDASEPSQPAPQPPVEVTPPAETTPPVENQPNDQPQQGEDKPNADQGNGDQVPETPAPNQPEENTPPASQPEDQPTEQPSTEAQPESKPSTPTVEVITPAGPRIINSSVGTLLANRRFISNLNVTPMSIAARPGFFMDVDRDSESLDFTGATYSSSYSATRTLIGQSFTLRPDVTVGVFVNAGSAKSQIDNQVNSATGTVTAFGVGGFAATNVGQYLYVSGAAQYLYTNSTVEGTHHQSEVFNGGFVAAQVASQDIQLGQYVTVRPYALLQVELIPTSHFISRIGEELGTVEADRVTKAIGVQANLHLGNFGLEVDAYQNLGSRVTEFKSNYTNDHISAANNNYRVKTTASYQVIPNVKVGIYLNLRGKQTTTGMSLDVKW